ncbi:MAG: saccharopine dehydrogenase NADP-binding domain-containing protein [Cyclobacteriaceae bacterium]|nr:saccharopine dehydrogenase NADP-binding domain-containing protein [Cyclobacteriaceae bacterium]MCH8514931.1 saccharopine dehydrogenase NADP-binding domain-containing protein [Cyclobacteriaceae bacterium]
MSLLIYGAYGYTGRLIAKLANERGIKVTLAGRNAEKVKAVAQRYNQDHMVFSLERPEELQMKLKPFELVIHCAGPFIHTAKPMLEACILSQTNYLDITGEIEVFEYLKSQSERAAGAGITVLPGVGFDVVPTDCMSRYLADQLSDATHLELAFMSKGGSISHGTMQTMVENLGKKGAARIDGKIVSENIGAHGRWFDFGTSKRFAMSIPWGDVSTAYFTTSIPNIRVFSAVPKSTYYFMKFQTVLGPLLRSKWVKKKAAEYVSKNIDGPTEDQNESGLSVVYGKVINAKGEVVEKRLRCGETYFFTAEMALIIAQKMIKEKPQLPGFQTPASIWGSQLVIESRGAQYF